MLRVASMFRPVGSGEAWGSGSLSTRLWKLVLGRNIFFKVVGNTTMHFTEMVRLFDVPVHENVSCWFVFLTPYVVEARLVAIGSLLMTC